MVCHLFNLGLLASLGLVYLGGRVAEFSAVKLFKMGLAKFKASAFWAAVVKRFPGLA